MQSFMTMRIAAFDNPNINTAYVSTAQIWLQGSDYDIDAVSLATYSIDHNGKLPVWSPYADFTSVEKLNTSLELPFPTGKKFEAVEYKAPSGNDEVYSNLIQFIGNGRLVSLTRINKDGERIKDIRINDNLDINLIKDLLENPDIIRKPSEGTV